MKRFKLTKRKRKDLIQKRLQNANRKSCMKKKRYKDVDDAWNWSEYYYITESNISIPYKCCRSGEKEHYHLTTQTQIGNLTHVPEDLRRLFVTATQEPKEDNDWDVVKRFFRLI